MMKRYSAFVALVLVLGVPYAIDPIWEHFHPRASVSAPPVSAPPQAAPAQPQMILQSSHTPVVPDFEPEVDEEGAAAFAPPPASARISESPPPVTDTPKTASKTAPAPSAEEPTENHAEGNTPLFTPDEIAQLNQRRRPYETMEDPSTAPELRTVRAPRSSAFRSSYPSSFSSSETNSLTLGNPLPKSDSVPGTHRVLSYRNEIPPERIAEERLAYAYETQAVKETQPHPAIQEKQPRIALGEKSFFVNHFTPGLSESGKALPVRKSIDLALDGPDYLLEESNDPAALKKLQSRVLGFGRGGELILEIADQGEIEDESGPDFVIYGKLHERFAKVAVSDRLEEDSFHWFECEPEKSIVIGCAGVVPTAQGGDTFDLRAIGVKSARYIKIKDWGKNRSTGTDPAWFELDSLKLIHASKPQP